MTFHKCLTTWSHQQSLVTRLFVLCGSHCWHGDGKELWQSQSYWVHVICTRMWRHTQTCTRLSENTSSWGLRCSVEGVLPAPESRSSCYSFSHENGVWGWWSFKGCSQKITEATGNAPVTVASLIRPHSSKAVRYLNCRESHVLLLLASPSVKKTAFPVFASASQ